MDGSYYDYSRKPEDDPNDLLSLLGGNPDQQPALPPPSAAQDPAAVTTGDQQDPWIQKALRARKMMSVLGGDETRTPDTLHLERAPEHKTLTGMDYIKAHPVLGSIAGILDVARSIHQAKRNNQLARGGYKTVDPSSMEMLLPSLKAKAQGIQDTSEARGKANAEIGNEEARYNANAVNAAGQRNFARMNGMLPGITSAIMNPHQEHTSAIEDKVRLLHESDLYTSSTPEERAKLDKTVLGAMPKTTGGSGAGGRMTPEETYAKTLAGLNARFDFANRTGKSVDPESENDTKLTAKYITDRIHQDGMDEEEAQQEGMVYLKALKSIRGGSRAAGPTGAGSPIGADALGAGRKNPGQLPAPPMNFGPGPTSSGPIPHAGHVSMLPSAGSSLHPDQATALETYVAQVNRFPDRRAALRAALIRYHGFDPEQFVTAGQ